MQDGTDRGITCDLRPHLTRSEMPTVTALTNVLSESIGWHRARMTFMARFVLSALQLTTTNLRRIEVSLKAGVIMDDRDGWQVNLQFENQPQGTLTLRGHSIILTLNETVPEE